MDTEFEHKVTQFFRYLYESFILRDYFGLIIPGIIVLGSIFDIWNNKLQILQNPKVGFIGWVIIMGISYVIGFVCLALGILTKITRYLPRRKSWAETYRNLITFMRIASHSEKLRDERFNVFRNLTGNNGVACLISSFIYFIRYLHSPSSFEFILAIVFLSFSIILIIYNHLLVIRQQEFREIVQILYQKQQTDGI